MKRKLALSLLAALGLALAIPAIAQKAQKSREPESKTAGEKIREVLPEAQMVFTKQERTLVTNWYRTNRSGLPPGLAKRDKLPPGLERHPVVGRTVRVDVGVGTQGEPVRVE